MIRAYNANKKQIKKAMKKVFNECTAKRISIDIAVQEFYNAFPLMPKSEIDTIANEAAEEIIQELIKG
jgi:hypothetical protein